MKIRDCTDIVLEEIAPCYDEIIAHMFAEIDADPNISLREKTARKKKGLSTLAKAGIGAGGAATLIGGIIAGRRAGLGKNIRGLYEAHKKLKYLKNRPKSKGVKIGENVFTQRGKMKGSTKATHIKDTRARKKRERAEDDAMFAQMSKVRGKGKRFSDEYLEDEMY